jgi:hypothetical protein
VTQETLYGLFLFFEGTLWLGCDGVMESMAISVAVNMQEFLWLDEMVNNLID